MTRWWRAYDDAINDPKLLKLSDEMHRAWFTLLCVASKHDGVLPPAGDIAVILRVKPTKVATWLAKLVAAGLFDNNDGVFAPHNWSNRQFKSDSSKERVKRHREKERNVTSKQDCNVTSTVTSNVTDSVTVTHPEQSRAETESEQSRADAGAPVDEDLKRRASALAAGVSAHFLSRQLPIPNLDRCLLWLTQGYAQGTVLAAIEAVLKRGKPISTLEYFDGAIKDRHDALPPAGLQVAATNVFVEQGTLEWNCWVAEHQRLGKRPPMVRDTRVDNVIKTGWWFPTRIPEGYDEATGERIQSAEDAA